MTDDAPYVTLWQFAERLAPCRAAACRRWIGIEPHTLSAAARRGAGAEARYHAASVPEWEIGSPIERALARRVLRLRFRADLLLTVHLPRLVHDALMRGGYEVTGRRPDHTVVALAPRDLAGLQPDLRKNRLTGGMTEYVEVAVRERPTRRAASSARLSEREVQRAVERRIAEERAAGRSISETRLWDWAKVAIPRATREQVREAKNALDSKGRGRPRNSPPKITGK
ncbi:MAG TPA: hypothetical protein VFA50_20660 [Stellaceae bacterium]|nr:hypothetical protein [Stellaceae bacterium]